MIDLVANIMAILTNTKLMIILIKKGLAFYIKVLSVNAGGLFFYEVIYMFTIYLV